MLAIRLPDNIEKRLGRLAKRTGRTKTYYAREAILQHLDDLEDVYLAEKALEEIRSGRSRTIPLEKIMDQYGLKKKTPSSKSRTAK
jgi:RHH-type rel operon transcriptional repressor/antitoxin RelB